MKETALTFLLPPQTSTTFSPIIDDNLYKSYTLGSNSWEFVRKLVDDPTLHTGGNCKLSKHPIHRTYHLHCKSRKFYISDSIHGDFQLIPEPTDPSNNSDWRWGGIAFIKRKATFNMYLLTTMSKTIGIQLTDRPAHSISSKWTNLGHDLIQRLLLWHPGAGKTGKGSISSKEGTAGWTDSITWFRSAKSLEELSQADDVEVLFYPDNTSEIKSMGSQHRQIFKVGYGQWMYLGSRHPDEDPLEYDARYGRSILAPVRFVDGVLYIRRLWQPALS